MKCEADFRDEIECERTATGVVTDATGRPRRAMALLGHAALGAGMLATAAVLIRSLEPGLGPSLLEPSITPLEAPAENRPLPERVVRTVYLVGSEAEEGALALSLRHADGIAFDAPLAPFRYDILVVDEDAEAKGFMTTLQAANETLIAFGQVDIVVDLREPGP